MEIKYCVCEFISSYLTEQDDYFARLIPIVSFDTEEEAINFIIQQKISTHTIIKKYITKY